jgi:hypothetical protein
VQLDERAIAEADTHAARFGTSSGGGSIRARMGNPPQRPNEYYCSCSSCDLIGGAGSVRNSR